MMKKTLPLLLAAATAVAAGASITSATAQTASDDAVPETLPADGGLADDGARGPRGDDRRDGEGRHGKHHHDGHRDGRGFGGRGGMLQGVFAEVDADGDGTVTREEIDAFRGDRVTSVDASGDGALSIEEFDTLYREFTRPRMVDAFQRLDENGDGVIDAAELDARVDALVERMDRDGDGALSLGDRGRGRRD